MAPLSADADLLRLEKLALVGELIADAGHECNNQLAFVLSNLQNLAEYGDDLARVLAAYRERVRAAGIGDAQLTRLETETDLDFLLEDAGRAARDGLQGATRLRDLLRVVARLSEDEPADRPLIDLGKWLRLVLSVEAKAISLRAELVADVELDFTVAASPGLLIRALVVMLKDALSAFADVERENNQLTVRALRRGGDVVVLVSRNRGPDAGRGLRLAELAAEALGGTLVVEPRATTLVLPAAS